MDHSRSYRAERNQLADFTDVLFGDYGIVAETVGFLLLNHFGFLLSLFYFAFSATGKQARRKFFVRFYEWQTKQKSTKQPKNCCVSGDTLQSFGDNFCR